MKILCKAWEEHQQMMHHLQPLFPVIEHMAEQIRLALTRGHTLFLMGNGGSAADAQHLAAEFVGRFHAERRALPAIALTTDTSLLTAVSNDYDFSMIFARQLQAFCKPGDVVIGISTSGNSANVLKGIDTANAQGAYTIGFTGESGGALAIRSNACLRVPSNTVARIQEAHIFIGHVLCQLVEEALLSDNVHEEVGITQ